MQRTLPFAALALGSITATAFADVKLPSIFGDHMVLQQDVALRFWGKADAGEEVTVTVREISQTVKADDQGKWRVDLPGIAATRDKLEVVVAGKNTITLRDVIVGEVWVASGQSNMQWTLDQSTGGAAVRDAASYDDVRLFYVERKALGEPQDDVVGEWVVCDPKSAGPFSAVALYFGLELRSKLNRPVGLIHTSWGGTPAEAWTPADALRRAPTLRPMLEKYEAGLAGAADREAAYKKEHEAWAEKYLAGDQPNDGEKNGWHTTDFDDAAWKTMPNARRWEDSIKLEFDGVMWLRKEIEIPERWAGRDLRLQLGTIDDFDTTYFNGKPIGALAKTTPQPWTVERTYTVPGADVKAGKAVIAIRVFDAYGGGGLAGPANKMMIFPPALKDLKVIDGAWKYAVERPLKERIPFAPAAPPAARNQNSPANLWNGMVSGIAGYPIRGTIWYQGESNAGRAFQYRTLMPTMIQSWRDAWGQGDFPFLQVQLAGFKEAQTDAGEKSDWPELREAQYLTTRALPNAGIATAIDIGEEKDIHPRNKADVGLRLARVALQDYYRVDGVVGHGPEYESLKVDGNRAVITFAYADGLVLKESKLSGFAVCGEDKQWRWGEAKIEGNTVVVTHPDIAKPVAVRYAWGNFPPTPLYNGAGLPALPFRTDDYPMITRDAN